MIIEKPFSYMVFRVSLPRSFSDGHIILTRERNLSTIVHVGPKEKQRPLKPVQPISEEDSSSENISRAILEQYSSSAPKGGKKVFQRKLDGLLRKKKIFITKPRIIFQIYLKNNLQHFHEPL